MKTADGFYARLPAKVPSARPRVICTCTLHHPCEPALSDGIARTQENVSMEYTVNLQVKVRPDSTALTADEHADAVARELRFCVARGLLTTHEPQAIIDSYTINVQAGS